MAVRYLPIDAELVSAEWHSVLTAARRAGVAFHVNEGHRTMARQWYFWNLYRSGRGNLAAYPSANAPHIRTGRLDHAIDVNGSDALIAWGRRNGVTMRRTVRGESWHLEASAAQLSAFHRSRGGSPVLRKGQAGPSVTRLQRRLRALGFASVKVTGYFGRATESAVKRVQKAHDLPTDGVVGPRTRSQLWR